MNDNRETSASARGIVAASSLTGGRIVNAEGEALGYITELMLDVEAGCIAYAVMDYHAQERTHVLTVPWSALTLDEQEGDFILGVERDKLNDAPRFDRSRWPIYAQDDRALEIHNYYGVSPYWHV